MAITNLTSRLGLTERRTIATLNDYADAQRAVDRLADRKLPVQTVAIVGIGLRYVEQVSGRLTAGRTILAAAARGAVIGAAFALLFGIFFTLDEAFLGLLVYSVVLGSLFAAAFAVLERVVAGGRRDFSSSAWMRADRYELQVDVEHADRASALLEEMREPRRDQWPSRTSPR